MNTPYFIQNNCLIQCSYLHLINMKGSSNFYTVEYYFSIGKNTKTWDTTTTEINSTIYAITMTFHNA